MRIPRFHCPEATHAIAGEEILLSEQESHHLVHVLRRVPGDRVHVLPGNGMEWEGIVVDTEGNQSRVRLERCVDSDKKDVQLRNPGGIRTCVAVALSRGGAFDLALEHLAELDADEIVPVICRRCVVRLSDPSDIEKKMSRWNRILEGACKQSGRRTLPVLQSPVEWNDWVLQEKSTGSGESGMADGVWIAEPEAAGITLFEEVEDWLMRCRGVSSMKGGRVAVGIGPEGGFTPEEVRFALDHGVRPARLGDHVLRVATAAAAAMTAIRLAIHHVAV